MAESIKYIGASTHDLDLFEGQYSILNGMAYNSYVIDDEKIAIMDTVDKIVTDKWLENLEKALDGREPEYLVVQHLEPDHSGSIKEVTEKYPEATPPHLRDNRRSAPPTTCPSSNRNRSRLSGP